MKLRITSLATFDCIEVTPRNWIAFVIHLLKKLEAGRQKKWGLIPGRCWQ